MRWMTVLLAALMGAFAASHASAQSIEDMAGQMIVVGFTGDSASDASVKAVTQAIGDGRIGGVMYLKTNVASLKAVSAMNAGFKAANKSLPPFITLDQEGGAVERLTKAVGFAETPTAAWIAGHESPASAETIYSKMARGVAGLGFTVNFGPVVDLDVNPKNQVITKFGRSYGADPSQVTQFAEAFVEAHHSAGILTSLKHFPGHGSSTGDTHAGFVDISTTWSPVELAPYQAMIRDGDADMIMVGHLYHAKYTSGNAKLPASLSPEWITGVLRQQLGFTGVVVTDDLEMGAIRKQFGTKDAVIRAVNAGADVLLFSNTVASDPKLGDKIRAILVAEAKADPAFADHIAQSYRRIVALKQRVAR